MITVFTLIIETPQLLTTLVLIFEQVHFITFSPAEPRYALPLSSVDPDQLASEEAN